MREPNKEILELRIKAFDLPEWQAMVKNSASSKRIFLIWDEVCRRSESRRISRVERDEMWDLIKPEIKERARLERQINKTMKGKAKKDANAA